MALPKLNTNLLYEAVIPSTKKVVEFRPFLVGEEKLFLIAAQSDSVRVLYDTIKRVISQCVTTEDFVVEDLKSYDLEYLFLQLRSKSVGEQEDLVLLCGECETKNNYSVDFEKNVYVKNIDKEVDSKIDLGNGVTIGVKAPSADLLITLQESDIEETEMAFEIIDRIIDKVYTVDEMFEFRNESKKDREEFIGSMSTDQLNLLLEFIANQPQISLDVSFICGNCGTKNERVLRGISDFFG